MELWSWAGPLYVEEEIRIGGAGSLVGWLVSKQVRWMGKDLRLLGNGNGRAWTRCGGVGYTYDCGESKRWDAL